MSPVVANIAGAAELLGAAAIQLYKLANASAKNNCSPSRPAGGTSVVCPVAKKADLTASEAQGLMRKLKDANLPLDDLADCSHARARAICDLMESEGIECQKFWYAGDLTRAELQPSDEDGKPLEFPPDSGQPVSWRYHVAPVIKVRQPSDTVEEMIVDPSLSDTPLSKALWKKRVGKSPTPREATTAADVQFPWPAESGTISVEDAKKALQDHRDNRDIALGR